jgi:hypothetical protein
LVNVIPMHSPNVVENTTQLLAGITKVVVLPPQTCKAGESMMDSNHLTLILPGTKPKCPKELNSNSGNQRLWPNDLLLF